MTEEKSRQSKGFRRVAGTFAKEVLVPIVLALVVIQFAIQAFKIPSASMEDSLLIGDFLLGLKFVYGSPIPFSDKKLPGFADPKPGDVLIFKYPGDPDYPEGDRTRYRFVANLFLFGNLYWDKTPAPGQNRLVWYMPKDFIKRCVAQSGQTLTVSGTRLLIDGKDSPSPPNGKYMEFRGADLQRDSLRYRLPLPGETLDFDTLSLRDAVWMRSLAHQENPDKNVELQIDLVKDSAVDDGYILPYLNGDPENRTHGAVYALLNLQVERAVEGNTVYMHAANVPFRVIQDAARTGFIRTNELPAFSTGGESGGRRVENNEFFFGNYLEFINQNVIGQGERLGKRYRIRPSLVIDGRRTHAYTVKKKCYFMMGDNRDNSSDGRYWGLLSKDYVKAKAFIIYFSFDNGDDSFSFRNPVSWMAVPAKIRWTRIGKLIE